MHTHAWCIHTQTYIHTYIHTYIIHAYIHTSYIHTYIHTYIVCSSGLQIFERSRELSVSASLPLIHLQYLLSREREREREMKIDPDTEFVTLSDSLPSPIPKPFHLQGERLHPFLSVSRWCDSRKLINSFVSFWCIINDFWVSLLFFNYILYVYIYEEGFYAEVVWFYWMHTSNFYTEK